MKTFLQQKKKEPATLYVVVDQDIVQRSNLDEIKKDTGLQAASPDLTESNKLHRRAVYSLPQVVRFVNSKDTLLYARDTCWVSERKGKSCVFAKRYPKDRKK